MTTPDSTSGPPTATARSQLRSRLTLLLIAAMFFGSFGIAAVLRFAGWTPAGHRNVGELVQPPRALGPAPLRLADGGDYAWSPQTNRWAVLAVPAADCTNLCAQTLDALHRVWLLQGRKADRLDVLWAGQVPKGAPAFRRLVRLQPDPRLLAALPEPSRADALPVYLVDPDGYVVLHYRAGFDPAGLRKDLGKLLK